MFRFPNIDVEGLIDLQASSVLIGAARRLKKITYLTMASGDLSGHGDTRPPHNKGTRLNVTEFMPSETRAINAKFNDADAE